MQPFTHTKQAFLRRVTLKSNGTGGSKFMHRARTQVSQKNRLPEVKLCVLECYGLTRSRVAVLICYNFIQLLGLWIY